MSVRRIADFPRQVRCTRRALLQVGSLGLGGVTLPDLLAWRGRALATEGAAPRRTAVIQVFLGGGPSHLDMFDPKPLAPAEVRGEFRAIATCLPGVQVTEHLPRMAQALDRAVVVRSVSHGNASHLPASHWMMTGYEPPPGTTTNANPACGAVVARARGPNVPGMPAYVSIPRKQLLGGAAYLGVECNPFTTESDPAEPGFAVKNLNFPLGLDSRRLENREELLAGFDRLRGELDRRGNFAGVDRFTREALEIVTGDRAREAFDLSREAPALRERYGLHGAGQRCLLARRLVEAGVTFVTVLSGGEWDTHANNFAQLRDKSLPPLDQALSALVTDIQERGLDRDVLVVAYGEFGRTPKINAQAGRDHWPGAASVVLAGGGLRAGQVIGATDRQGAYPTTHPYSPGDVLATLYDFLGIDVSQTFVDRFGRALRLLPEGRPITELRG